MEFKNNSLEVATELERLAIAITNPAPALQQIGKMMRSRFADSLERGMSPEGVPHVPLKSPRRSSRRGGNLPSTLFVAAGGNSVTVGYNSAIAIIYHEGARIPARKLVPKKRQALFWAGAKHPVKFVNLPEVVIPARPLVGHSNADVEQMENLICHKWDNV